MKLIKNEDSLKIYQGDSIKVINDLKKTGLTVDCIFADPPFNLNKEYKSKINDNLTKDEYLKFQNAWLTESVDILKEGGSIFIFNIPKWNIYAGEFLLSKGLELRHWIAIDMTLGLPIRNRLYPSHYSLLYFTKGKPRTFNKVRTPIESCRHCGKDIKDYGGHRNKIHPDGINLKDIWTDVGKMSGNKNREANELPEIILERCINISTNPGDLILDPFAGSGTCAFVAKKLNRSCVSIELDDCTDILKRVA